MNKIIAFDLEIVKEIPEGIENWRDVRPLGISCAAALASDRPLSNLWFNKDDEEYPLSGGMDQQRAKYLVQDLMLLVNDNGYTIITWNGLGFDFDVLAEESGMLNECTELALNHIDMAFQFLCMKGYMIGLEAASMGLGFGGKMSGMSGVKAPQLWASSNLRDRLRVLRYVHQDVVTTLEVYEESSEIRRVPWTSKSGKPNTLFIQEWLPVKDCLKMPLPDTSWMDNPWKREEFYAWMAK
jgi:hypothetical protein